MDDESIKEYFDSNNIPYQTQIAVHGKTGIQTIIPFVLPYAILQIFYPNAASIRPYEVQKKLDKLIELVPEKFMIYALIDESITNVDMVCDRCGIPGEDEEESIIAKRITFITNVKQIVFDEFKYYCQDNGIIRSFGSFRFEQYDKYLRLLKNKLYVPKTEYMYAISLMTDEEIERLNAFNPHIIDNIDEISGIVIRIKNSIQIKKTQHDIITIITTPCIEVKKCGLDENDAKCRYPLRVIEGITHIDSNGTIMFTKKYKEIGRPIDPLTILTKSQRRELYRKNMLKK